MSCCPTAGFGGILDGLKQAANGLLSGFGSTAVLKYIDESNTFYDPVTGVAADPAATFVTVQATPPSPFDEKMSRGTDVKGVDFRITIFPPNSTAAVSTNVSTTSQLLPIYLNAQVANSYLSNFQNVGLPATWASKYKRCNQRNTGETFIRGSSVADWNAESQIIASNSPQLAYYDGEAFTGLDGAQLLLDPLTLSQTYNLLNQVKMNDPSLPLFWFGLPWASDNQLASVINCSQQMRNAGIISKLDYLNFALYIATYSFFPPTTLTQYLTAQLASFRQVQSVWGKPLVWTLWNGFLDGGYWPVSLWEEALTFVKSNFQSGDVVNLWIGVISGVNQVFNPTVDGPYFDSVDKILSSTITTSVATGFVEPTLHTRLIFAGTEYSIVEIRPNYLGTEVLSYELFCRK